MAESVRVEKFLASELANLRVELLQSGIDSWQAAELMASFLAGRGYGVNSALVRDAAIRLEGSGCSFECIQQELERVAFVM